MSRPETINAPELFYNETESKKYNSSSRMINIQTEITERALEMLDLPTNKPSYLLDIGCGSGLSGDVLEEHGHYWVGCDISKSMLDVALEKQNEYGDLVYTDIGQGLPYRPGSFDGAISISAIQWLCYSNSSEQDPRHRLNRFFSSLYSILKRNAKAILQFYPENAEQAVLIAQSASRVGFSGGLVVDYPNSSKAKKYYLCLSFERSYRVPNALGSNDNSVDVISRVTKKGRNNKHANKLQVKSVDWIKHKKEQQRKDGKSIKNDSKFTGRKRAGGF
eukprot:gene19961-25930_t